MGARLRPGYCKRWIVMGLFQALHGTLLRAAHLHITAFRPRSCPATSRFLEPKVPPQLRY